MKKAIGLLLAVALLLTSVACQPTPEEEFVVQRDVDAIEEKLQAGSSASQDEVSEPEVAVSNQEQLEAYKASLPQHWSEEFGNFIVDADIVVDNTEGFPVYTIARAQFNMPQLEGIANNFFGAVIGVREGAKPLKSEYADAISSLNERGMVDYAQALYREMTGVPGGSYTEADRITLSETKNQQYMVQLADGAYGRISFSQGYGADYMSFDKGGVNAVVHLKEDVERMGSYIDEEPVTVNPTITTEQGEKMVTDFLEENNLEGFTVASITAARHFDVLYRREISQGWKFALMRTYGYYAVNTSDECEGYGWISFSEDTDYSQPWRREVIEVYVSENGIEYFGWNYPMEVKELTAESVELLGFEQIQENIRKLLPACVLIDSEEWTGKITKVALTVVAQQVKDDRNSAYLMPVWVVFIDWYTRADSQRLTYNLFGINALDGSRAVTHGTW